MTGKALNGNISPSLGANDPRLRRNAQASLAESQIQIDATLRVDDRQRLGVAGASDPGPAPTDTVANLAAYIETLVSGLRSAGLIQGD